MIQDESNTNNLNEFDVVSKISHVSELNRRLRDGKQYPVYITDNFDLWNNNQDRFLYLHCLDRNNLSNFFTPTRKTNGSESPVVFLAEDIKIVEWYMKVLSIAGIKTYYQDINKPYEIINAGSCGEAIKALQDQYNRIYNTYSFIDDFRKRINQSSLQPYVKTGFNQLDKLIGGGLSAGLYIIAAAPGEGKTSYCLQLADQIAANGHDVIYFSLEMSKYELLGRSISRMTFDESIKIKNRHVAKSELGITDGRRYINYSQDEKRVIDECIDKYKETIGKHISIYESIGQLTPKGIENVLKDRIGILKNSGTAGQYPVVFLDYLQLMQSDNKYAATNDKLRIDLAITELKRLSRDYNIPVVCISSMARGQYYKKANEISLDCFKETGSIEYGSDIAAAIVSVKETESEGISNRLCRLVVMKNRRGTRWKEINYQYTPIFNSFTEIEQ